MSLRIKLILGFAIPSVMMVVVGVWSSVQMRSLGTRVRQMLDANERSIRAAVRMNESIERLDSGVLLRLHGDEATFRKIHSTSVIEFKDALRIATNNVTLPGEKELLDTLHLLSDRYLGAIDAMDSTGDLESYWLSIYPTFKQAQQTLNDLSLRNSEQMYSVAQGVSERAHRAALPGELIIVAAVVFYLLFAWLTQLYMVRPLHQLINSVQNWRTKGRFEPPQFETKDEIQELTDEISEISRQKPSEGRR